MTDIVETYLTNRPMRESYFRMNCYTCVDVIDSDNDPDAMQPFLCGADQVGTRVNREFYTIGQVHAWAKKFAPELEFIA